MTDEVRKLWNETLSQVSHLVPRPGYEAWVRPAQAVELEGSTLVLGVPSTKAQRMVEERYLDLLEETASAVFKRDLAIHVVTPGAAEAALSSQPLPQEQTDTRPPSSGTSTLNPRYDFESFVVGNSNRLAHAAALAVCEKPGRAYNPLFIYGGVGLGKTHLMHAIGNEALSLNRKLRVLYVSAESFTNDVINAIRDDKTPELRRRYRPIDLLLIDDIQFISGKERTQEEFFHTFEALHSASRQIVMSSDRLPREIPTLTERLRSRFEWGLITDVQPPDFETRVAILRKKAQKEILDVPDEVLTFIADRIQTNIRELEGALIRLVAYLSLTESPCTMAVAEEVLQDLLPHPKVLSVTVIQQEIARLYGVSVDDLCSASRARNVTLPRQVAMYLARQLTDASLPRIGQAFGNRDHTTVLHSIEKVQAFLASDPSFREVLEDVARKLSG